MCSRTPTQGTFASKASTAGATSSTSDGSITLQGRLDALRARTGDGSVVVKLLPGSRVNSEWSLSTGEGPMVLYVPEHFGAEFDAETGRGAAKSIPALSLTAVADLPRGVFRGTLANGGHLVRLRTRDGAITIKRLPGKIRSPRRSRRRTIVNQISSAALSKTGSPLRLSSNAAHGALRTTAEGSDRHAIRDADLRVRSRVGR